MRVRVKYSKQGLMRFIGHLDMMRYFQKACRRAGIDVVYTEGMSPHMSMSFALPLGVGMTSDSEYVDVDLVESIPGQEIVNRLNRSVPEGIHFTEARQIPEGKIHKGMNLAARADFTLRMKPCTVPETGPAEAGESQARSQAEPFVVSSEDSRRTPWDLAWHEDFLSWLKKPEIMVMKKGKKALKEINIRPLIFEARFDGPKLMLGLSAGLDRNIRPELVMQAFADQTGREYHPCMFSINRDEVYADKGKDGQHAFVPLIALGKDLS